MNIRISDTGGYNIHVDTSEKWLLFKALDALMSSNSIDSYEEQLVRDMMNKFRVNSSRQIKSSKFFTSGNKWRDNTAVLPVSKQQVKSFFDDGSWSWDDTVAVVGRLESMTGTIRDAVIFGYGKPGDKPYDFGKYTGLFNDQSWGDIGYFYPEFETHNPQDVWYLSNCRYFVLK